MKRSLLMMALLASSCSGETPSPTGAAGASDQERLREILGLASQPPREDLRRQMEAITRGIEDPALRSRVSESLGAVLEASKIHPRLLDLEREVSAWGGVVTLEPGGPAWMRAEAGDRAMHVFDRLTVLGLNDKSSPHSKDYKLNNRVNDAWLDRLRELPDLRSLDIANADVHGPGLQHVGTLRSLESLNLTLLPISDDALGALSGLSHLKSLGLASTKITGTGIEGLGRLRNLENLNCHSTPANDEGLARIGQVPSLKRLEIVHTQFTDAGTRALSGLVNLERLHLGSRRATGAGLVFLRDLPRLRELDVHDGMMTAEGFRHVGAVKTLRVLRAYGGSAGDEGVSALAGLPELETLVLEGTGITDRSLGIFSSLSRLRKLTLHEPKVTDAALAQLRAGSPGVDVDR
jgi:Leucine-rich repeat (LRR) protein